MSYLDQNYISGISSALCDLGELRVDSIEKVAEFVDIIGQRPLSKYAMFGGQMDPSQGMQQQPQPSEEELAYVTESGITENDIQAAAKVIQVIAEMKQQADQRAMATQQTQMQQPMNPMMGGMGGQPPLPPQPTPPPASPGMQPGMGM